MASDTEHPLLIQDPSIDDIAKLVTVLRRAGIPSALWGVNAAGCYGGRLCYMDIELAIKEIDQERVFDLLRRHGCHPSQPTETSPPENFHLWRKQALHHEYIDRRRFRLYTPIYTLPRTGDEFTDFLSPFIMIYSAEMVGLPPIPPFSASSNIGKDQQDYITVDTAPCYILGSRESQSTVVVPVFKHLVQSVMHVLLRHADALLVWAQLMAELAELVHSPVCNALDEISVPTMRRFAQWVRDGESGSPEFIQGMKDEYRALIQA
ncbi:hypothetical protein BDV25DRAFT_137524 [Aspergillus avenaceus]|uniref:Uncharacterized protein n=1 Tax=Aspergillus avenaceus TaxID=36643 RepID=A0A5N6U3L9_ASPAV|nr:hypothetical protein BDV25DRAFT_137524 [Aspergillus avenaceus]